MILHAPDFYKVIVGVLIIWIIEFIYRVLNAFMGKGKTLVSAGVILPSRVTNLIIKRPAGFNFSPGDWVFIKVPEIARFEWHPFTISSAPQREDVFTLHVRGVGNWTNSLYKYFEDVNAVTGRNSRSQSIQRKSRVSIRSNNTENGEVVKTNSKEGFIKTKL